MKNSFIKLYNWFDKDKRELFIVTFILGFILNIALITSELFWADSLSFGNVYISNAWDLSLGRWFLRYIDFTRFGLSSILVSSTFSLIILSLCVVLVVDLFKIKKLIYKILISLILSLSPFFTETLLSAYFSFDYTLSLLFSILSIYLIYNLKNKKLRIILSSILLSLSLGIYQAYLGVSVTLALLVPLIYLINKKITKKEFIEKIIESLIFGIIGIILYEVILKLHLLIWNIPLSNYSGASEIGLKSILDIPFHIKDSYISFYNYFFNDKIINNIIYRRNIINIILFILTIIILIKKCLENKDNSFIIILSIILLPIALGIIELVVAKRDINSLMSSSYIFVYIFILSLLEKENSSKIKTIITFLIIFIVYTYFIMSNATYKLLNMKNNGLIFTANKILDEIYELDDYTLDKKVLFIGSSPNFTTSDKLYELASGWGPTSPLIWDDAYNANRGWRNLIKYHFGIELKESTMDDYEEIIKTKEYKTMPTYPSNGYIKQINDIIVVKIK